MFRIHYVGMFTIYSGTKFRLPHSNDSLVIIVRESQMWNLYIFHSVLYSKKNNKK
jgi:hypothetical protein